MMQTKVVVVITNVELIREPKTFLNCQPHWLTALGDGLPIFVPSPRSSYSVADPDPDSDPYVSGPPGSGSISTRYGSGSFCHHA